jgi:hypothetical protein
MNTPGKFLLSGKMQAIGLISLLTLLSMLLPPFSYIIGGAPVGLLTLRKGPVYSLQAVFGALLLTSLFGYITNLGAALGAAFALGIWMPVWLVSLLLRISESQGFMLVIVAGVGVVLVLGSYLFTDELSLLWQSWLDRFMQQDIPAADAARLQQLFDASLPLLNGIIAAGFVISLAITVILARWWQSRLFNPGGFRTEFQELLLPRWLTLATFVCLIFSVMDLGLYQWPIRNVLIVLIVSHVLQGIASVHRVIFTRKLSSNWLIAMYGFLVFLPQMGVFVACIGMVDVWVRHRKSVPTDQI